MYRYVKRALDIIFAVVAGMIVLPFAAVFALIIKADDPAGPVLFRQTRVGKNCARFTIYKYRTMREQTRGKDGRKLADVERMTDVGKIMRKFSLDEIPQLWNILRGDMSFIGPRPLLVEYIPRYTPFQMRRHEVLSGVTGWAQVNGRNALSWEQKFICDVWYVEHLSFATDCKILGKTIKTVLSRRGVNQGENMTMPVFMGSQEREYEHGE